jgi:hypothetical protein
VNASTRSEVVSQTDPDKLHSSNPGVDALEELCSNKEARSCKPVELIPPDEHGRETFINGAGI